MGPELSNHLKNSLFFDILPTFTNAWIKLSKVFNLYIVLLRQA
jgi:hypothetical protein